MFRYKQFSFCDGNTFVVDGSKVFLRWKHNKNSWESLFFHIKKIILRCNFLLHGSMVLGRNFVVGLQQKQIVSLVGTFFYCVGNKNKFHWIQVFLTSDN